MIGEPITGESSKTGKVARACLITGLSLLTLLFAMLLPPYCWGLEVDPEQPEPLTLKVSTRTPERCRSASITVEAELTNTSEESLAIDPRFVWYQISFLTFRDEKERYSGGSRTLWSDPGPSDEGKYLVLKPGESFRDRRDLSLMDKFFQAPGKYTLQLTYAQFRELTIDGARLFNGSVRSNEIEFKIIKCRGKKQGKGE